MPSDASVFIVTYDIREPKRLRQVYKLLRGFGEHLQFSVFRCALTPVRRAELVERLREMVHQVDQVLLIRLGHADTERAWEIITLGTPVAVREKTVRIV